MKPVYSIVVPIYNEEAVLPILLRRLDALINALDGPAEAIIVDDGSTDSGSIVCEAKARSDKRYRYVRLSRNFGHQIAISSGLDLAGGDAVVVMDGDLQDPPEVVLEMAAQWRRGYEVVSGERLSRDGESQFKKTTADLFYWLVGKISKTTIPRNVGDFRLVDRKVVDCFRDMPERDRLVRGMFAWLGFRQTVVRFHRPARGVGETKYPIAKMLRLAVNGLVSFSDAPLRVALWLGMGVSLVSFFYGCWVIAMWILHADLVPGWSSLIVVSAFLGGANMMMTGVMGLYVGRIYDEAKGRPLYVIDRLVGFDSEVETLRAVETRNRKTPAHA
jgi:glycosyltransferase involved in cell wall biosynthesis